MSLAKNIRKAKKIVANEAKEKRSRRNQRVKDYIELKKIKGHSHEEASKMAQDLIDQQG